MADLTPGIYEDESGYQVSVIAPEAGGAEGTFHAVIDPRTGRERLLVDESLLGTHRRVADLPDRAWVEVATAAIPVLKGV